MTHPDERAVATPTPPVSVEAREAEDFLRHLREVNAARLDMWANGQDCGALFHATELAGEVGEALNVVKKLHREAMGWRGSRATMDQLRSELADVLICLDKLAMQYGVDLEEATIAAFNATSEKVGLPHKLARFEQHLTNRGGARASAVARVARAIWTAPITGQPLGEECRNWPPTHPNALTETYNQARAALSALSQPAPHDAGDFAATMREMCAQVADEIKKAAYAASNKVGHENITKFSALTGQGIGAALVANAIRALPLPSASQAAPEAARTGEGSK